MHALFRTYALLMSEHTWDISSHIRVYMIWKYCYKSIYGLLFSVGITVNDVCWFRNKLNSNFIWTSNLNWTNVCVIVAIRFLSDEGHCLMMVEMTALQSVYIIIKQRAHIQSSSHTLTKRDEIYSSVDNYACAMHTTVIIVFSI